MKLSKTVWSKFFFLAASFVSQWKKAFSQCCILFGALQIPLIQGLAIAHYPLFQALPNVHAAQPLSHSPRGEFLRGRRGRVLATAAMEIILVLKTSAASSSTVLGNPIAGHQNWRHSGVCPKLRRLGFFSKKCWTSSFIPEPLTRWFLVSLGHFLICHSFLPASAVFCNSLSIGHLLLEKVFESRILSHCVFVSVSTTSLSKIHPLPGLLQAPKLCDPQADTQMHPDLQKVEFWAQNTVTVVTRPRGSRLPQTGETRISSNIHSSGWVLLTYSLLWLLPTRQFCLWVESTTSKLMLVL